MKASLDDVLSESGQLLLIEAPHGRPFEKRDLGIPQIDRLLFKLGDD